MKVPFSPLIDDEFSELDQLLVDGIDSDEGMTIDMMDGFFHAIAIGPTTLQPRQWLPKIWGTETMLPPVKSINQMNRIVGLVMRHYNDIIAGLQASPPEVSPAWMTSVYEGKEYDDAEGWACGFVEGMKLCWMDWQPMLQTPEGRSWFRPIGLLGEEDFGPDQDEVTRAPARRGKLALQIPNAILAMHAFWLPHRYAIYQQEMKKASRTKVGRNDPCPCGSEKKFKKCCGAAPTLH